MCMCMHEEHAHGIDTHACTCECMTKGKRYSIRQVQAVHLAPERSVGSPSRGSPNGVPYNPGLVVSGWPVDHRVKAGLSPTPVIGKKGSGRSAVVLVPHEARQIVWIPSRIMSAPCRRKLRKSEIPAGLSEEDATAACILAGVSSEEDFVHSGDNTLYDLKDNSMMGQQQRKLESSSSDIGRLISTPDRIPDEERLPASIT